MLATSLTQTNRLRVKSLVAVLLVVAGALCEDAALGRESFSVDHDVSFREFATLPGGVERVLFSPDRNLFAVQIDGASLDLSRPESTVLVFRVEEIRRTLATPTAAPTEPLWSFSRSESKQGPNISEVRWLRDSSGLAFIARSAAGGSQAFLADVRSRTITPLTPPGASVTGLDVLDKGHFVYAVQSSRINALQRAQATEDARAVTGLPLSTILFPPMYTKVYDLSELWAVVNGRRFRVTRAPSGVPVDLYRSGARTLSISPDGRKLITILRAESLPKIWLDRYLANDDATAALVKRSLTRKADSLEGVDALSEYVLIDLLTGEVKLPTHAPLAPGVRWPHREFAGWSPDGASVLLSNTFVESADEPARPCIAVVRIDQGQATCVKPLKGRSKTGLEKDYQFASNARFAGDRTVIIDYASLGENEGTSEQFVEATEGRWTQAPQRVASKVDSSLDVEVYETLNSPPVLLATDRASGQRRVILDPNPTLADVEMGSAAPYKWLDETGRQWNGVLYWPTDYDRSRPYPLVIQTHGIVQDRFIPSGLYPVNYAARELAAVGIAVLQVQDCTTRGIEEGPCQIAGYRSAIRQLTADGLADADKLGISGFSRTCFYVLEALTEESFHFQAASIADGIVHGYMEYMLTVDQLGNIVAQDAEQSIGARPIGDGLVRWSQRSPAFNMHRVNAPLQIIVTQGPMELLSMWEPYAALRMMNKPVDMLYLSEPGTHPLTNPSQRLFTQQSTLDWFRFWLQNYEDRKPGKAAQYARWRELRELRGRSTQSRRDKEGGEGFYRFAPEQP